MQSFLILLVELGPVVAFLIVATWFDFFTAIAVSLVATVVAVGVVLGVQKRIARFALVSTTMAIIFGVSSLLFQNEALFIVRDTISGLLFAAVFLGSIWYGRPVLKPLFDHVFAITDNAWQTLTRRWGLFYLVLAVGNEAVRVLGTPDGWVLYKTGTVVATVLFGLYQFRLAMQQRLPNESNWLGLRIR